MIILKVIVLALPDSIDASLRAIDFECTKSIDDRRQMIIQLREEWGEPDTQRRSLFDERFAAQMQQEPVYMSHRPYQSHDLWLRLTLGREFYKKTRSPALNVNETVFSYGKESIV